LDRKNINATYEITKPENKYPHDGIEDDKYFLKKIEELNLNDTLVD